MYSNAVSINPPLQPLFCHRRERPATSCSRKRKRNHIVIRVTAPSFLQSTAADTLPAASQTGLWFWCNLEEDVFNPRNWALNSELVMSANLLSVNLKGKWRELM